PGHARSVDAQLPAVDAVDDDEAELLVLGDHGRLVSPRVEVDAPDAQFGAGAQQQAYVPRSIARTGHYARAVHESLGREDRAEPDRPLLLEEPEDDGRVRRLGVGRHPFVTPKAAEGGVLRGGIVLPLEVWQPLSVRWTLGV